MLGESRTIRTKIGISAMTVVDRIVAITSRVGPISLPDFTS
jgi:hypothetical protein